MIEENKQRKNKVIRGIALLGLFLMVFGISYALFRVTLNGKKTNKITTAKFDVRLTTTDGIEEKDLPEGVMGINLEGSNAVPMSQEDGLTLEPYKFVVQNRGSVEASYKLTLEDMEGITNTLDDQYIRYNLVEKDYYDYKEYHEGDLPKGMFSTEYIPELVGKKLKSPKLSEATDRVLDETTLMPNECIEYTLNLWIDEEATTEQASEKEFSAKIKVDATQASIFGKGKAGDNINYTYYKDGTLVLSGTGAMKTIDEDATEIYNNMNPYADILFNYFVEKGIINQTEITAENFDTYFTYAPLLGDVAERYDQNGNYLYTDDNISYCDNNISSFCDRFSFGSSYTMEQVKQMAKALVELPIVNRVIVEEGITEISYVAMLRALGMVSLPNSLASIKVEGVGAPILIIPNSVVEIQEWGIKANKLYIDNTEEYVENNFELDYEEFDIIYLR